MSGALGNWDSQQQFGIILFISFITTFTIGKKTLVLFGQKYSEKTLNWKKAGI